MTEITVQCPWCFEPVAVDIAPEERGVLVQDCDVCCRPLELHVFTDADGEPQVTVERS